MREDKFVGGCRSLSHYGDEEKWGKKRRGHGTARIRKRTGKVQEKVRKGREEIRG